MTIVRSLLPALALAALGCSGGGTSPLLPATTPQHSPTPPALPLS